MAHRFQRWFRSEDARREIDEEIASHLAARREQLVRGGLSEPEAEREALRRFGDLPGTRAALLQRARARHRRLAWSDRLDQFRQDGRYVRRSLTSQPIFSLGVIATLALGLGINAAVFRVADHVLFRPPSGVSRPQQIRRVEAMVTISGAVPQRATIFSYPDLIRVLEGNVFERTSGYSPPRMQPDDAGGEIGVSWVDGIFFDLLGVRPFVGRFFDASETQPGTAPRVAVVSADYWRGRLAAQPLDAGLTVTLARRTYRIVGVAPRGFSGIDPDPVRVWLPLGDAEFGQGVVNGVVIPWYRAEMGRSLRIIGRTRPDGDEHAEQRLSAALSPPAGQFGQSSREGVLKPIVPVGDSARADSVNTLLVRLGAVAAIVLVIASCNAVNLLLARGLRRSREIAIRVAVGASRWRVARLLLAESVVLAGAGAVAATICGLWTAEALRRLVFPESRWTADSLDARTLLFTAATALAVGIVAGVVPAFQSTRHGLLGGLKEGRSPSVRAGRTRAVVIVAQTALSIMLLVGCGLLVRSLHRLNALDLGFEPAGLVLWSSGRSELDESGIAALNERLRSLPDVRGTALASIAPFGATASMTISVPGSAFEPESALDHPLYMVVAPEFFPVMGMRVLTGRAFSPADVAGADPVAIVNESMARRYWPGASPFTSCIIAPPNPCARVVGVVSDLTDTPGGAPPPMRFYLPLAQRAGQRTGRADTIVVRTRPEATATVITTMRSLVTTTRPPTIEVVTDRIRRALHPWRTAALLFTALGAIALILACVGIYSVMSYLVAERLHEMGLRMALGATGADVLRLILGNGLRLIGLGAALGLLAAASFAHLLQSLLYGVSSREPLVYTGAAACLIVLSTAAMLPAAVRAARVDPVDTLRTD